MTKENKEAPLIGGPGSTKVTVSYQAQYEINTAIQLAFGRLENDASHEDVYKWLNEDLEIIYKGGLISED